MWKDSLWRYIVCRRNALFPSSKDAQARRRAKSAWDAAAAVLNASSLIKRTTEQVKNKWRGRETKRAIWNWMVYKAVGGSKSGTNYYGQWRRRRQDARVQFSAAIWWLIYHRCIIMVHHYPTWSDIVFDNLIRFWFSIQHRLMGILLCTVLPFLIICSDSDFQSSACRAYTFQDDSVWYVCTVVWVLCIKIDCELRVRT